MGFRTYREIEAWQLAVELRRGVVAICETQAVVDDRRFREQLLDSTRSVARNIAEGFGRRQPKAFAHYLTIARASLEETDNHLRDGVDSGYFSDERAAELIRLTVRCRLAVDALHAYLVKCAKHPAR